LANAALSASEFVGWPEARIPLAEATIYIATANKSNSAITAIDAALADVKSGRTLAVPEHLRDGHYAGAKKLGHGVGYEYAHNGQEHFVAQDYLGAEKIYYEPTDQGVEKKIKERVEKWRGEFAKLRAQK
jgi:putative ATPase